MEAEIRVLPPPAKEHQEQAEAGRGKETFSPTAFRRRHGPASTLILASTTAGE